MAENGGDEEAPNYEPPGQYFLRQLGTSFLIQAWGTFSMSLVLGEMDGS